MIPSTPIPSDAPFTAGLTARVDLDDLDALQEFALGWDMVHSQVGRGKAKARLVLSQTARMQLCVVTRSPGFLELGAPPAGTTILCVPVEAAALQAQKLPWDLDAVGVVPKGTSYELLSTGPCRVLSLCVDHSRLDAEAIDRWGQPFPPSARSPFLRFRSEASHRAFVATCARWMSTTRRRPELLVEPTVAERMEGEILGAILDGVERRGHLPVARPDRDLARRVESFIRRSLQDPIAIRDICHDTGASARTVHASSCSVYGMSPKAYWKALRLAGAHRDLQAAGRGRTVSEVATRWGFFRFGYFSVDYRSAFGENPRDTLRRTLGRKAVPPPGLNSADAVA